MEELSSVQSLGNNKPNFINENLQDKYKEIINSLIPNLLNDLDSEQRTFNENNIRTFFNILIESKNTKLCSWAEDEFYNYYCGDDFATECGIISIIRDIRTGLYFSLDKINYFMWIFMYYFETTKSRLFYTYVSDEENSDKDSSDKKDNDEDYIYLIK